jgi:hypothetical protein
MTPLVALFLGIALGILIGGSLVAAIMIANRDYRSAA